MTRLKCIVDTDPGIDDAIAILMALNCASIDVLGFTTTGGNISLETANKNILSIFDYLHGPNNVYSGSEFPIKGSFPYATNFHGESGLSKDLPAPVSNVSNVNAVDFINDSLCRSPNDVTLICLGPLTNIYRLFVTYPDSISKIGSLVLMGGAVNSKGNVTPHAEFNFYCDPIAADYVLSTGVPITLVDLKACRQVGMSRIVAHSLSSVTRIGQLAIELIVNWFGLDETRSVFEFYDPLALAIAIDPDLATYDATNIAVNTNVTPRYGETVAFYNQGSTNLVNTVDADKFFHMLADFLDIKDLLS